MPQIKLAVEFNLRQKHIRILLKITCDYFECKQIKYTSKRFKKLAWDLLKLHIAI